jgi:uncharacterized membrane protein YwzB
MISLLISILIACLFFGLLYWALTTISPSQPFLKVGQVAIVVVFVIWLIYELLPFASGAHRFLR